LGTYRFRDVPFSSWLYRIAHNCVIDHFRAATKQPVVALDDVGHLLAVADRTDRCLDRDTLAGALGKITDDQRQVVLMRIVHGLSVPETAKAVGESEASV